MRLKKNKSAIPAFNPKISWNMEFILITNSSEAPQPEHRIGKGETQNNSYEWIYLSIAVLCSECGLVCTIFTNEPDSWSIYVGVCAPARPLEQMNEILRRKITHANIQMFWIRAPARHGSR